jgi:amidohydrolase
VQERLVELGIPFTPGVGGHEIVATISRSGGNGRPARSVGLRADMDALGIAEATGLPYASRKPGVMHACGHDGHTVSLLGAALLLMSDPTWSSTVRLVFQPAEESVSGAKAMVMDGLFSRFPMQRIFGYHNWPGLDAGTVAVHQGPVMAAGARVTFTITGEAAHAAMPQLSRDPVLAAGHLIVGLQSIIARNLNPIESGVISLGMIEGGTAPNQIPHQVKLFGTCRSFSHVARDVIGAGVDRIAAGVATMLGIQIDVDLRYSTGATVNSAAEAELAAVAAASAGLPVRRDLPPAMTGEDFAYMLEACPGAFVWIGNGPGGKGWELHNDGYDYNDTILPCAAAFLASVAKQALQ